VAAITGSVLGAPSTVQAANSGFVRTQGARFVLNGSPFYFVGTNAFFMMVMTASGSHAHTDQTLAMANQLGFSVLRTWAFYDGGGDGLALQPSPGVYNEAAFQALDYVLHQADQHGVRLILSLVNGPPEFGGMNQYVGWCAPGQSRLAFYTNGTCRQIYQDFVRHLVTRVNTLNGRRYADDPTIFAWELANEPDAPDGSDMSGQGIRDWVRVMAAFVKSLDANHMVTTGEVGYDITTEGYSSVAGTYNNQTWAFNGWKGAAYTQNTADPNIDFAQIHLYPEYWNFDVAAGTAWIVDHARIAKSLGKPMLLGEFGASQDTIGAYNAWLAAVESEDVGGALNWQLMCEVCYGMRDQFGVMYPPNTGVSDVLAQAAAKANAKTGGDGGEGFPPLPAWAAPYIRALYRVGITSGCTPNDYCPDAPVTRAEMAVFILKAQYGAGHVPPAPDGLYGDVPTNHWAACWIEHLTGLGIAAGCGGGNFCPDAPVSRAETAVFLLRARHGAGYVPPAAVGRFADVPPSYWAAAWIERFAAEGITSGCSATAYCPDATLTRAQMAVFLVKAFGLQDYAY
jgi:mannan endo-1,4-beta-mannosidase